jgi:hypothetical protein
MVPKLAEKNALKMHARRARAAPGCFIVLRGAGNHFSARESIFPRKLW